MMLEDIGDEVRGARILCIYRKRGKERQLTLPGDHRARRLSVYGYPARAIVEKPLRLPR